MSKKHNLPYWLSSQPAEMRKVSQKIAEVIGL
jgi:hypothetical protein